jgi:hypothetical protein
VADLEVVSDYTPKGDQPEAIRQLADGVRRGEKHQTLLGITGSGKTATMSWVIEQLQRPTLVIAPNKTLAAQLYSEFRKLFPKNAVEYFVSYYDYYQPEAYIPTTDVYIEKDSSINEEIDKLRHSATRSVLSRRDVIVVASVSCIYGLGSPETYEEMHAFVERGARLGRDDLLKKLVSMLYDRNDYDFHRGTFRVRGDTVEIFPAYEDERAVRIEFFGDEVESITEIDPATTSPRRSAFGSRSRAFARSSTSGSPIFRARESCSRHRGLNSARCTTSRCYLRWASATASRTTRVGWMVAVRDSLHIPCTTTFPMTSCVSSMRATLRFPSSGECTEATVAARRLWSTMASGCPRRSTIGRCASRSGKNG